MPELRKAALREARQRRERYGQRGQSKWWHAVARSQARRASVLEERAARRHIAGTESGPAVARALKVRNG